MVELSGLTVRDDVDPDGDVEIQITGLRPGEKLYEELLIGDNPEPTSHPRIMRARENFLAWERLDPQWQQLQQALASHDMAQIRLGLQALVAGYVPSDEIVDWIHLEQAAEIGVP
jgi:FlaA1/EpsC-like NDP-sugar epimerase